MFIPDTEKKVVCSFLTQRKNGSTCMFIPDTEKKGSMFIPDTEKKGSMFIPDREKRWYVHF